MNDKQGLRFFLFFIACGMIAMLWIWNVRQDSQEEPWKSIKHVKDSVLPRVGYKDSGSYWSHSSTISFGYIGDTLESFKWVAKQKPIVVKQIVHDTVWCPALPYYEVLLIGMGGTPESPLDIVGDTTSIVPGAILLLELSDTTLINPDTTTNDY